MNKKTELLLCECSSLEHQLIINYFPDDTIPDVYVGIYLPNTTFWKRLKNAIKYVFGYKCRYGAFEEVILNETHVDSLKNVINHINKVEAQKAQTQQLRLFDNE